MSASSERDLSKTDHVLLEMLRENTGRHFLDSGDAYGRHHERNQLRNIETEPSSVVSFKYGEIAVTHSTFHWLRERLDYDEEANDSFDGPFREECDPDDDKSWGALREEFPEWFARWRARHDSEHECDECDGNDDECDACAGCGVVAGDESLYEATGIYGEGEPVTVNSYNEENLLDQVILFTYFELRGATRRTGRHGNEGSFIVLQIHGGCDVRGGYTRPRIFRLDDNDELGIFDFRRGTVFCETDPAHWWSTDDGSHWYREGACGRGAGAQLESYDRRPLVGDGDACQTPTAWAEGVLFVTDDGHGLCPCCGGRLRASAL
jgi:hypothetical protein